MANILGGLAIVDEAREAHLLVISKYYQLASFIVLLYDHILTIDMEIERVWQRNFTPPDVLFALNRYFPLLSYAWIITAYHQTTWSESICRVFSHFPLVATLISDIVIVAIVILRVYAMFFRSRRVLLFLGSFASVGVVFGAWAAASVTLHDDSLPSGCIITVKDGSYHVFGLLWGWSVLFDSTVCIMTVWRSLQNRHYSRGVRTPLFDLLLRDGVIYFAVMSVAKVVNFIVFWTISRDLITINWTFNHIITVVMVSHLFLNVRAESLSVYSSQTFVVRTVPEPPIALSDISSNSRPTGPLPSSFRKSNYTLARLAYDIHPK